MNIYVYDHFNIYVLWTSRDTSCHCVVLVLCYHYHNSIAFCSLWQLDYVDLLLVEEIKNTLYLTFNMKKWINWNIWRVMVYKHIYQNGDHLLAVRNLQLFIFLVEYTLILRSVYRENLGVHLIYLIKDCLYKQFIYFK